MLNVVNLSGGKDSTAMLLMMLEKGIKVDYIVFADTGMEYPQIYEHLEKVKKYIGREITKVKADHSWEYFACDIVLTKGKNKGKKGYRWPSMQNRWCTSVLKIQPINRYIRELEKDDKVRQFIGLAYDEQKRIKKGKNYPLVEWQMTEADCLKYCYDKGFDFGGLYNHFRRLGCYICPLQRIKDWKTLRCFYPEQWRECLRIDNRLSQHYMANGKTLHNLESRFAKEDLQGCLEF